MTTTNIFKQVQNYYSAKIRFINETKELLILASSKNDAEEKRKEYIHNHCDSFEPIEKPSLTKYQGVIKTNSGRKCYDVNNEYLIVAETLQLAIITINDTICNSTNYEIKSVKIMENILNVIL